MSKSKEFFTQKERIPWPDVELTGKDMHEFHRWWEKYILPLNVEANKEAIDAPKNKFVTQCLQLNVNALKSNIKELEYAVNRIKELSNEIPD